MKSSREKNLSRRRRHSRVRKKVFGTPERLRLNIFRSNRHIYAQIINDQDGTILAAASTLSGAVKESIKKGSKVEAAKAVGVAIALAATGKNITRVVFDRGGYLFHGRVKALAEAAREKGLHF